MVAGYRIEVVGKEVGISRGCAGEEVCGGGDGCTAVERRDKVDEMIMLAGVQMQVNGDLRLWVKRVLVLRLGQ